MLTPESPDKIGINYSQYPFLHTEDSPRKIAEIMQVVPAYFRIESMLDVGCDAALITRAIGEAYRAKIVHGLDMSVPAFDLIRQQLAGFPQRRVIQEEYEHFEAERVYDLTMFIDVLEHMEDPLGALRKAATMSKFGVVRSPLEETYMNRVNKRLRGKDYKKMMEERYGHIQHFNMASLGNLINEAGFDVINGENFRVPPQADILSDPIQGSLERFTWHAARGVYPNMWGGFYVAFCKSRNYRVLDPEPQEILLEALADEFGRDNIVSLGLFGSVAQGNNGKFSDYDFTVILQEASNDSYQREVASPRLKRRLRERGANGLYAFNIYTQAEFDAADNSNSWIIETMKNGNRVVFDSDHYLEGKLRNKKASVEQVGMFAWKGIKTENPERFMEVSKRHNQIADLLKDISPELASYHRSEAKRGEMIAKLFSHGIYMTRGSILDLAKRLVHDFGEEIDLDAIAVENFQHETQNIPAIYGYEQVDINLKVAGVLIKNGFTQDALFHTYTALKSIYLQALHNNDVFVTDGEITQLFTREFQGKIPEGVLDLIYQNSFKAEQILGRSGYQSFDMNEDGKPIYEDGRFDYESLMVSLRVIIEGLGNVNLIPETRSDSPKVSIVIATYNRFDYLTKCLQSLDRLIIPKGKIEIVIVDDGSEQEYDVDVLKGLTDLNIRYVKKEHSGVSATKNRGIEESRGEYLAFLDDDMEVSPLWLTRLLSSFRDERVAGVGSTNLTYPDSRYLTRYSDYRELLRRPFRDATGEILNVATGSACIRKDVLIEVGGFNRRQSEQGVFFGGDDVDITYAIRNLGYLFTHAEEAYAFHNHRNNLRSFIRQHIGYGEGTMFHCIDAHRNPSELGIPNSTYQDVAKDLLRYLGLEVPKRMLDGYQHNLGIGRAVAYPALDFSRRLFYDLGILRAKRFMRKDL